MKKVSVLGLLLLFSSVGWALPVKELIHRVRGSVVLLTILDAGGREVGSGTGFVLEGGLVATNYHVVENAHGVRATLADGGSFEALGVIGTDKVNDLAILRFPPDMHLPALPESSGTVEPGDKVVVVGNPLGLSGTVSEGIVSAVREEGIIGEPEFYRPLIQITAPISPGSSGSPVFNVDGQVVGVAALVSVTGQNLNFAIPISFLIDLQASSDSSKLVTRYAGATTRWDIVRNVAISLLLFSLIAFAFRKMRDPPSSRVVPKQHEIPRIRWRSKRPKGWGE